MYVTLDLLTSAQDVFDHIPVWDVISWTALIAGYVEDGQGQKALECYEQMEDKGVSPNLVTLVCRLKACGFIGAVDMGWKLHSEIERRGLLKEDKAVGNSLVDMYAKCGFPLCAQQVFEKLSVQDVVS
ncbi:hypothetical protein L7F22_066012 [Adiantum nelumboides]|nr:hypothetical protein [Adiantum nelumboides]